MSLTKQERDPHPQLVACRRTLEAALGLTRRHAAATCNKLSDKQVEAVISAEGDPKKVQKAVESAEVEPEPAPESKPNPRPSNRK